MILSQDKPVIGITMGEPAGVGAEVIVKALAEYEIRRRGRYKVYGLNEMLTYAADMAELDIFWWRDQHERVTPTIGGHNVMVADYDEVDWMGVGVKKGPSKLGGEISLRWVNDAIDEALAGKIDALVTGPISKESWRLAGSKYPGHTELLAKKCRAKNTAMMFVGGPFRVVLATIHEGLFDLRNVFTIGRVFNPIDLANEAMKKWFGIEKPKIAVAGLNPHAGENGQFGDEELRIIKPAILMAQEAGIDVEGPIPADTLFYKALSGRWDAVVAMYHDQGLIPVKMMAFDKAVNVTLGLPIIRTSPAHGAAFDIVGQNEASAESLKAAINLACDMVEKRMKGKKKV